MPKSSTTEIEKISLHVYKKIHELIQGKIANQDLAKPIENALNDSSAKEIYRERVNAFLKREKKPEVLLAQYWLIPFVFICLCLNQSIKEEPQYTLPFFQMIQLFFILFAYMHIFNSFPLKTTGARLFLPTKETKHVALRNTEKQSRMQAQYVIQSPLFFFFSQDTELKEILSDLSLSYLERDAIAIALFSVKHDCFDCIGASILVLLKLIQHPISAPLERIHKMGPILDPHSFIIVNRTAGTLRDFNTWNADCHLIDPWYGVCKSVDEIRKDPYFFCKYPLLSVQDKFSSEINKEALQTWQKAAKIFDELMAEKEKPSTDFADRIGWTLLPRKREPLHFALA